MKHIIVFILFVVVIGLFFYNIITVGELSTMMSVAMVVTNAIAVVIGIVAFSTYIVEEEIV